MTSITAEDIAALSVDERLDLIDKIWCSFGDDDFVPLSKTQRDLLGRRLEALRTSPEDTRSWEDIKADIRAGR